MKHRSSEKKSLFSENIRALTGESLKIAKELFFYLFGSLFLAISSQITLPWIPIPFTAQPQAIFYLCAAFGPKRALASVCLFLLEGIYGLPVFAHASIGMASLLGPSGGFLLSFPLVTFIFAAFIERYQTRTLACFFALNAASSFLLLSGSAYLCLIVPLSQALKIGFFPFIGAELAKNALLAILLKSK